MKQQEVSSKTFGALCQIISKLEISFINRFWMHKLSILFFENEFIRLPRILGDVLEPLKRLTTHLYTSTKDLAGIKTQAKSTIEQHYQQFIAVNRSELCFLCGTSLLSQNRVGLDDDDQWRSDYDHILCKDKYPAYSVHPGNFIPTCHICNSKAKGKRDLLSRAGYLRRTAFYPLPPLRESCSNNISLSMHVKQLDELIRLSIERPFDGVDIEFVNTTLDLEQKINVWDEVYQVPSRVKAHIGSGFLERILSDLQPNDFDDFKAQLMRHSIREPLDVKRAEWRFWWFRLYQFLAAQTDEYLADIWAIIQWKLRQSNDQETDEVYEI